MKKIIALLLTLSLLLCANAVVYAMESDDGGQESIASVEDAPETSVESSTEAEADPTEDSNEAETSAPAEQSDKSETSDPAAESGTPETTEPTDESTAPEGDTSIGDSETSQEPTGNEAEGNMQPANNAEPVSDDEMLSDPPPASNVTYNVTVKWTGLSFTYHEPKKGEWKPETGQYAPSEEQGYWTSSDGENKFGTITVTNNDENDFTKAFRVNVSFTKDENFTPYLEMLFSTDSSKVNEGATKGTLEFLDEDNAQTQYLYVYPRYLTDQMTADAFSRSQNKLGVITITIESVIAGGDPTSPEAPGME